MNDNPPLAGVRRRALRAVNQDGLVDTFLGFTMLMAALYMYLDKFLAVEVTALPAVLPLFVVFGIRGLRKRYTWPRVGYADLKTRGARVGSMVAVAAVFVLLLGLFLLLKVFGITLSGTVKHLLPLPLVGGIAVWFAVMARQTGFNRYYVYAALLAALLAATHVFGLTTSLTFIIPMATAGLLMLVTGIACFARFLRRHPEPQEVPDAA